MSQDHTRKFDPRVLLEALRYRWKLIVLVTVLVPVTALTARALIKPKVKMSAQILVQESVKVNPFLKDMMVEWSVKSRLPLITSIVRSRTTLERVLSELGEIRPEHTSEQRETLIRDFQTRIDVFGEGGGLIRISVVGRDPEGVYNGLTLLTEAVVEEMLRPQKEALDESVRFLKVQLDRIESELRTLEEQVKDFKRNNASELPEVHRLNLDTHMRLSNSVMETESALVAAQQRKRLAEQRLLRYDPVTRKLRDELEKAEKNLRRLRGTFTDAHPKVRTALGRVNKLTADLEARDKRTVKLDVEMLQESAPAPNVDVKSQSGDGPGGADIIISADDVLTSDLLQYQAAAADVEAHRHKLELLKTRLGDSLRAVRSFAENEQTLNRLVRNLDAKSKVYTNLLSRYEDALVTRELTRHDESKQVWIVERPAGPLPARPVPLLIVLAGAPLAGLFLGVMLALAIEFLDRTVREEDEAAEIAGAPVLGTLPWLGDIRA